MDRFQRVAVVTALGVSLLTASAVPAAAARDGDCILLGPNYVEEAVDCAVTIISLLVGGDPI